MKGRYSESIYLQLRDLNNCASDQADFDVEKCQKRLLL